MTTYPLVGRDGHLTLRPTPRARRILSISKEMERILFPLRDYEVSWWWPPNKPLLLLLIIIRTSIQIKRDYNIENKDIQQVEKRYFTQMQSLKLNRFGLNRKLHNET